jgi:CheY-like chemotaxis protein
MTTANRIRVLIAGNVYVKRALVRRSLEGDGYEVVGDVMAADAVVPAIRAGRPDAIVLDEDLTAQGAGIASIRAAAPGVRVIVFTSAVPGAGAPPLGADGYLDKGVGLAALTALLGQLFAEPTVPLEPLLVVAGLGAAAATGDTPEGSMDDAQRIEPRPARPRVDGPGGNRYRVVAMVAGVLLIVWGVVAAIDTGSDMIAEPETTSALDEAYASLDRMIEALQGGHYIPATVEAETFMDQRRQATSAGFATAGLDAEVTTRLEALVPDLPFRVGSQLADILRSLYPAS